MGQEYSLQSGRCWLTGTVVAHCEPGWGLAAVSSLSRAWDSDEDINTLEETLDAGKVEGRTRRRQQRMR